MSLVLKQHRFAIFAAKLILKAEELGYTVTLGEAYRTIDQQMIYMKQGLTKTNNSFHMHRLAIDINLFKDGTYLKTISDYKPLGEYWESLDPKCVWGGSWGWDAGHFQYGKEDDKNKTE